MPALRDLIVLVCPDCGTVRREPREVVVSSPLACTRCRPLVPPAEGGPVCLEETATLLTPVDRRWARG